MEAEGRPYEPRKVHFSVVEIGMMLRKIRTNADNREDGRTKSMVISKLEEAYVLALHIYDTVEAEINRNLEDVEDPLDEDVLSE